ncbi:MAG: hypothetical protein Kow0077_09680 [Anaerolineae bacterium]
MAKDTTGQWVIEFIVPGAPSVARLIMQEKAVIGRADKQSGVYPDLDLTPWGGIELGIAPEHVVVTAADDQLMVADLGSGKPTLLNGQLLAQSPRVLNQGDDLQLGVLHLHVNIVATPHGAVTQQGAIQLEENLTPGNDQPVLIVEDEPESAEIFRLILKKAGYRPIVCREVVSAIRALGSETPAAIVLDLMLPDIHGLELCRYVRQDTPTPDIPIVVVSAAAKQGTVAQAMEVGADVFLGKPFSMRDLVRVVASMIQWHEAAAQTVGQTKELKAERLDGSFRQMPRDIRKDAVMFFVAGYDEPIAVMVQSRITIGRRSGSTSGRPHVDLERFGAFEAGVSRIHAALYRESDGFYLEDLSSSNGTFINGERLEVGRRYPVANATEIKLGSLPVRIFFLTEDDDEMLGTAGG